MSGCGEGRRPAGTPAPFALGLDEITTGRRTLLAGGAGAAISTVAGVAGAGAASGRRSRRRAYVLVVDGCKPQEIDSGLTPNLHALRAQGLRYSRALSMPVMETIPNHVMMMTGVRPDRSDVPANEIYDRRLGEVRTLERARDLRADTVIERMNRQGLTTGTVLSKEYLYGIFGGRATHRWEPFPVIPLSGHAPDEFTISAATDMVEQHDPNLVFVNLGDVDRYGHTDYTGPLGLLALRRLALLKTDRYVGRFVQMLKDTGRWRHSIVIVLADHSMDWSLLTRYVSLTGPLEADPMLAGKVQVADNGGADLLYWTGARSDRDEAVRRMRRIAQDVDGVEVALDRRHRSLRLGPEAGDVVVYCEAGWRFSEPDPTGNPIPGNHGHLPTRPIPFFVAGGHPSVPRGRTSQAVARTVDVAPTLASFFGLRGRPRGGWDGTTRLP